MHRIAFLLLTAALAVSPVAAEDGSDRIEPYGDFRFRLEQDWDSRTATGAERADRARARIRVRLGVDFRPTERVTVGARLRSGSDRSQQSPHITIVDFDGGDTGDADFNLDRWFLRASSRSGRFSGWIGCDGFPFWRQNELFWDDDVTLAGIAGSFEQTVGANGRLAVHAGWFSLPVGMRRFSGELGALQVVYGVPVGDAKLTVAGGYFAADANPADPDAGTLLNGDGLRDYAILVGSVQVELSAGGRPLTLGADLIDNREDYPANAGETGGFVFSARYGSTSERGDWLAGYTYARIESLAVIASYAQDDWVRWGNGPQTRGSNFRGHELRFARSLARNLNVVLRLYLVESITTIEDGKRFRVDFNYRFR